MGNAPGPVLPGARRRKPTPADGRSQPGAPAARSGAAVRRRLTWRVLRRLSSPGNFSCRHRSDRSRLAGVPAPPRGEGRPRGHRARTGGGYLGEVVKLFDDPSDAAGRRRRAARREVGLAAINAEESFQRFMGEHQGHADELGPMMTLLTYVRRFSASTAALALTRHTVGDAAAGARDALTPFAVRAAEVLDALALSLAEGRSPPALPPELAMDAAAGALPPLVRTRVERLTRQLKTLHDAVERWVSARAREPSGTGARDAQRHAVGLAPRKGAAPY